MILHPTQRCSWGMLLVQCSRRSTVSNNPSGCHPDLRGWTFGIVGLGIIILWITMISSRMQQGPRAAVKSFPARCAKSMSSWTNDQKQSGSPWLPLYDRGRRRPSDKLRDFLHRDRRFGISQGPQDYQSGDTTLGDHHGKSVMLLAFSSIGCCVSRRLWGKCAHLGRWLWERHWPIQMLQ